MGRLPPPTPHNVVRLPPIDKGELIYFDKFDDFSRIDIFDKMAQRRMADAGRLSPSFHHSEEPPVT
jgi:hypothetical protein